MGHEMDNHPPPKSLVLCLIPSHIGILGNEMVDQQAKTSLS